jgi:HEAT repeat protein
VKIALVLALAVLGTDMGELRGPEDVERALKRLDSDKPREVIDALRRLGGMGPLCKTVPGTEERVARVLAHRDEMTRVVAAQTLGRMEAHGQAGRLVRVAREDASRTVRKRAYEALGRVGGFDAAAIRFLIESRKSEDVERRRLAARALGTLETGRLDEERIVAALIEGFADEDVVVRSSCIWGVSRRDVAAAASGLVEAALGDPCRRLRRAAASSLARLPIRDEEWPAVLSSLRERLSDPSPEMRLRAVRAILTIGERRRIDTTRLLGMMRDESEEVRVTACDGITRVLDRPPGASKALRDALSDPAPRVRLAAARSLLEIRPDEREVCIETFFGVLESGDSMCRVSAAVALWRICRDAKDRARIIAALEEVARTDPDPRIRRYVAWVLERLRSGSERRRSRAWIRRRLEEYLGDKGRRDE